MDENITQLIDKRKEYNLKILDAIKDKIEKYPMLRFGQILILMNVLELEGLRIKDPFYDESVSIYNRLEE